MQTENSNDHRNEAHTANRNMAKWWVTCFYDACVVKQTAVLLMNFSNKSYFFTIKSINNSIRFNFITILAVTLF
jgi:hypothetical protein